MAVAKPKQNVVGHLWVIFLVCCTMSDSVGQQVIWVNIFDPVLTLACLAVQLQLARLYAITWVSKIHSKLHIWYFKNCQFEILNPLVVFLC